MTSKVLTNNGFGSRQGRGACAPRIERAADGGRTGRATTRVAVALAGILGAACGKEFSAEPLPGQPEPSSIAGEEQIEVPPPPLSEDTFPCTECHDPEIPVNKKRRQLKLAHREIVLRHDEEHRWCLDCHSPSNRDKLHLANGELIDFTESYRLCGQCHGDKYRDWRAGVHGRRSGSWNGHKTYLLCVNCHNSHAPAFEPIAPLPPPRAPERTK